MKLNRMKGSFYANLQLLNATKLQDLVSEIKTLGNDGFKLEKVSVNSYDAVNDQMTLAIQAFAVCQTILDLEGIVVDNLLGKQKKSINLASGSAGQCDISVQTGVLVGEPKFDIHVLMTQSSDQKLLEISRTINMDEITYP